MFFCMIETCNLFVLLIFCDSHWLFKGLSAHKCGYWFAKCVLWGPGKIHGIEGIFTTLDSTKKQLYPIMKDMNAKMF